ncbi:phosphatase 2C-like domain-containing protein [Kickxella alabastrina]|uniref:phosphatase 2C-like domain-containing protein n=1 Tax=Kickxella alabastrina TaxID=61397 RepID=UPI00221F6335|nr:phosphatase 2C-like domain-containing protein [Kickxella alabastrina]KAI7831904.1 phosphatase 2C-like domain-containing protein [Kickxella alabastrina]
MAEIKQTEQNHQHPIHAAPVIIASDSIDRPTVLTNPAPATMDTEITKSPNDGSDNDIGSPAVVNVEGDNPVISNTSTFPAASTIQPPARLQRTSIPPPIDTENASKDADNTLRSRLLSTLSSSSLATDQPAIAVPELVFDASERITAAEKLAPPNAVDTANATAATGISGGPDPAQCEHIGVSFSKNRRYRRTMEDAHYHKYDFDGIRGQCFMAIFDGHAGRQAAQWCGDNFSEVFLQLKRERPELPVPELLNETFVEADRRLATDVKTNSGCTAVVAYLEIRDIPVDSNSVSATDDSDDAPSKSPATRQQRTLYCANAGDARAVLSRGGNAARLTYDHKGDDVHEIERISESGGYVFNGRVNGILAVTRSLGDPGLKQFVIGNPFTTETILNDDDDILILACDGLWDVCSDQEAILLDYALHNESMDNVTAMVLRMHPPPHPESS